MGKKYLLYIHDDRFGEEAKKSDLVNDLLAVHYAGAPRVVVPRLTPSGKSPKKPVSEIIEEAPSGKCTGHSLRWNCGRLGCKY